MVFRVLLSLALSFTILAVPAPTRALAANLIDSVSLQSDDASILHVDPDLEEVGNGQTYLINGEDAGESILFDLSIFGVSAASDLSDTFKIIVVGATLSPSDYSGPTVGDGDTVDDDDCTVTWTTTSIADGIITGSIDCSAGGVGNDNEAHIEIEVTAPLTGTAAIHVMPVASTLESGEIFTSSFIFISEPADEIYVGSGDLEGGDAECPAPDFSTDGNAQESIEGALEAAFLAVDDANDVIVICDGEYEYQDNFKIYDLTDPAWAGFADAISVRAETSGDVLLNGAGFRFFTILGASLTLNGLRMAGGSATDFVPGEIEEDFLEAVLGPIGVVQGDLGLLDSTFASNTGLYGGVASVVGGDLVVRESTFEQNTSYLGGALSSLDLYCEGDLLESLLCDGGSVVSIEATTFEENCSLVGAGAVFGYLVAEIDIIDSAFVRNGSGDVDCVEYGGPLDSPWMSGAVGLFGGEISIESSIFSENESSGSAGALRVLSHLDPWLGLEGEGLVDWSAPSLSINASQFEGNHGAAGGAINIAGVGATILRTEFSGNVAGGDGGAVLMRSLLRTWEESGIEFNPDDLPGCDQAPCGLHISGSSFESNQSSASGGGVFADGVDVSVDRTRFGRSASAKCGAVPGSGPGNWAAGDGGALYVLGGGLALQRSQFYRNCAFDGSGGGIYHAAGIEKLVSLTGNAFVGNGAGSQGGGVRLSTANRLTRIVSNTFSLNTATQGGALSMNDGVGEDPLAYRWTVSGNDFASNAASEDGGALHMAFDNSGYVIPNGVRRNTFSRNGALVGGAVVVESNSGSERQILTRFQRALRDNRFTGNRATRMRNTAEIGVHFD